MFPYVALFAASHMLCAAAFGCFAIWREESAGVVGGGLGIIAIWFGVWTLSSLFARRRRAPPSRRELTVLYTLCCAYLFAYNTAAILLNHRAPIFQPSFPWLWNGWISLPVSAGALLLFLRPQMKRALGNTVV
jgi:hypothetical protein